MKQSRNNHETIKNQIEIERGIEVGVERGIEERKKTFTPPTLKKYQKIYFDYAKKRLSDNFKVDQLKCELNAESDYKYWKAQKWKRKGKFISVTATIQNAVNRMGSKLKDWDADKSNEMSEAGKQSYLAGVEAIKELEEIEEEENEKERND